MKCNICKLEVNGLKGLSIHLKKKHKFSNKELKDYYDKYLKKEGEGRCYFCNNEAIFYGFSKGYHRICESEICLGKTRATGTYEFLMYKYNLNKQDAIKLMNERANDRGKKIKKSLDKKLKENPNFHKEKSHQTKEYWIKRGLSKKAKEKAKEVMSMIHKKAGKKRKENPDLYDDILPTQLKYWLKKGYTYKKAKNKLKERQTTFSLDICIEKYGEDKGIEIYNKRQINWSKKVEHQYRKGLFSKTCNSNYSKPELELFENVIIQMNLKNNYYSGLNENQFFRRFKNKTYSYDFVYGKKIIEFNGEYWHCNPKNYKKCYYHKHRKMTAQEIWNFDKEKIRLIENEGYEVLIIWENDYKQNPSDIVKRCIDFLQKKNYK